MSSSILNIGVQALNANQTALSYVGQNISNVNTEGYSRQTVQFGTQDPPILGVEVQGIKRITDQFLISQVWSDTSTFSSNEAFSEKISLLDNMLVSESTSLSAGMDDYFASLQQVVDDPLFIANRELFLAEAQTLANSFNDFDAKLRSQTDLINTEVRSMANTVNSITENIASLNVQIGTMVTAGQSANELMDRRDLLVKELSGYLSVNVISQDGMTYNVMMGDGQPLVVGSSAASLQVRNSDTDPTKLDIYMTNGSGVDAKVTNQLGEGAIGGMVRYRDEVLQPTINEVGRIAIVFSNTMNEQHLKGMDLNGDMGQDLFRDFRVVDSGVVANTNNKNLGVTTGLILEDVTQLTGSDYRVEFTGLDRLKVTRLSDGKTFDYSGTELTDTVNGGVFNIKLDGMNIQIGEEAVAGDAFLVQPTRTGAQLMDVEITNPKMLALASPLRVEPEPTNTGNAELVSINIENTAASSLLRQDGDINLEVMFNDDGSYSVYDTTDENNPVQLNLVDSGGNTVTSLPYESGEPIAFSLASTPGSQTAGELSSYDFSITLENQPNEGDSFTIERNINGYSDNSNALALSNLQNETLVNGFSYQETYGQLLAKVGTKASTGQISLESSRSVLEASENALQSVAGVNLDEEAANLVKFQQAYSAAAQIISAYQTIFDSLISAVRR